ncbi:hypothetical protein [Dendrosporobacter sp. 1207_IL3150]|uniref:hypothetical protein n=1 Tax=Dendrosporobacter sp. 1207_IL3150 TaxID=3084054 RepID=UPI002FDA2614
MSEQKIVTLTPQPKWDKKKIGLLLFAIFFLAGAIAFQFAASKVRQAAEQSLLARANASVNGQIIVGGIDLSILGNVEAREVQVLDKTGTLLAKIHRAKISYNWGDLITGQLGPHLIKAITLDNPELWANYHDNRSNWDDLFKKESQNKSIFSGLVKIENGKLHLKTAFFEKTVEQLAGTLDFKQENNISLTASGKVDQAILKIEGQQQTNGSSDIVLSGEGMELTKLGLTAGDDPIKITDGKLDELKIEISNDMLDGLIVKTLTGRFSGVNTVGTLVLNQGSAKFEKQGSAMIFSNGEALYKGQNLAVSGQVLTAPTGQKTLDFDIQMPAGDPSTLVPNLQTEGNLSVQGKVTGSVFSPVMNGNFSLGSMQFGSMVINHINGSFSYTPEMLKLISAKGSTIGGSVAASGDIDPDTEQYNLAVSGNGLDSSQLTVKDVKGPLSLSGTAIGSAEAATVQGNFTINNGSAYGISFRSLTGTFIKKGLAEAEVSNLAIKTDLGTFYPEQLSQHMMDELNERNLPTTRAQVKEKVKDRVTEKVIEKLFR